MAVMVEMRNGIFDFINACTSSRIFNIVDVKEEVDENAYQTDGNPDLGKMPVLILRFYVRTTV